MRKALAESPTKEKLFDAARDLMMAKGFSATAVDEVCEQAGVSKGSFFHYFRSKEDLGFQLLERYTSARAKVVEEKMNACGSEDALERIDAYLDCVLDLAEETGPKGCLVGTFSQEISETYPELRELCAKIFEGKGNLFCRELEKAKHQYEPKIPFEPREMWDYFLSLMQGTMILVKVRQGKDVVAKNIEYFRQYLKSLFGK